MSWQNIRHAIDEWNNANAVSEGFSLELITPSDPSATIDERFCDIIQRKLVAIVVDSDVETRDTLSLIYSMCNRFRMPCLVINGKIMPSGKL